MCLRAADGKGECIQSGHHQLGDTDARQLLSSTRTGSHPDKDIADQTRDSNCDKANPNEVSLQECDSSGNFANSPVNCLPSSSN